MKGSIAYLPLWNYKCIHVFNWRAVIFIFIFLLFISGIGYSQVEDSYEEVSVTLNVQRIGSTEIPAIIHGQVLYMPIKELFDFLKIKNSLSPGLDSVSGFFINPKANFLIDKANNQIVYQDELFDLKPNDLVRTENNLYLKSDYFGQVFGLECVFSFRSLSVTLNTKLELPAVREMQQELMRRNISQLKGEKKADTTIGRNSSQLFHFGMADWSVISLQETKGQGSTRMNLGIGAIIAGGEADFSLNYNTELPFNLKQQYYHWRFVNNDNPLLRQITVGKIFAQSISSIYAPVNGFQFTNTPTTFRRAFGTFTLSNTTEPGWTVELYVNNVLVNYTKADASGFFTFEVPTVYGNSVVKLRFYGPWGEEQTREQYISIPFNFLPKHQFEYSITAGIVADDLKSRFMRTAVNYGLGARITVGGGVEYLSSVTSGKTMPFLNASLRLSSNLLITGEHTYGVRSKAIVSYRLPSNLQFDLNYTRYDKDQTAIRFNYLEERKAVLSMPFHGRKYSAFSRLTINQFKLTKTATKYTSAELLLSGVVSQVSSNFTTYASFTGPGSPLVYSNLSLTFRLPADIRFTPQVKYEYTRKNFSMIRCEVERNIFREGFLNLSYQKDLTYNNYSAGIGFRYNFSFAQTSFSVRQSNFGATMAQSARGSLMFDDKANYFGANNQINVGKGGIIILPYLDLNCNGLRDPNEPKAFGLKLRINGGRIENNTKDSTIRVTGLEAYTNYYLELDKNSFENIAWQMRKQTIRVVIDANSFKVIEVPVAVVGEVSGTVFLNGNNGMNGLGRMIVNFYNSDSRLVASTLTESDGFFSFIGLNPGNYIVRIDAEQLLRLNMESTPSDISFSIKPGRDGDLVEGLKIVLNQNNSDGK